MSWSKQTWTYTRSVRLLYPPKACADHYSDTRLADQNAELKAELRKLRDAAKAETPASSVPAPLISYGFRRQTSPQPASEGETLAQLRQDFAKAQQDRSDLNGQVESLKKELEIALSKARNDAKKISHLNATTSQLATRLRDREEELRGKAKLLVDVQDENATLNLQLNVAERDAVQLKKENQELIDRWMKRMGREADKMNEEGKFN